MFKKVTLHTLSISNVTMKETLDAIIRMLDGDRLHAVFTPNAEIVMQAVRDPALSDMLNRADLLLPDGAGVVLGAKILGTPLKEKVSGIDVAGNLMEIHWKRPIRFFLFGAKPGVAEQAAVQLLSAHRGIEIAGYRNGYFQPEETPAVLEEINRTHPDILFVCLGAPRQEQWIDENREKLTCRVALGLGGSLDVFAGTGKLAPEWMRKAGLEWLFRLLREPHRWKRMLDLPRFVLLTLKKRLTASRRHGPNRQ